MRSQSANVIDESNNLYLLKKKKSNLKIEFKELDGPYFVSAVHHET